LQAYRQAIFCESAGYRDRRDSPFIEGTRIAQHEQFGWTQLVGVRFQVADRGRRDGSRGREKNVYFFECCPDRMPSGFEFPARAQGDGGRRVRSRLNSSEGGGLVELG